MANKNTIIGISVTPGIGLEVAQIDCARGTVLKYDNKELTFDNNRKMVDDIDVFKETLRDLLTEMRVTKNDGAVVLNFPTVSFGISDYSASLDLSMVNMALEEELSQLPVFSNEEIALASVVLPSSTVQTNRVAYSGIQRNMLLEIVRFILDLGFKIKTIETSVNTLLKALMYKERVNVEPDTSWTLLVVDNFCCRIISMLGKDYLDYFEERIAIGEVLGDAENYSTVISAVEQILNRLPSQYLCIVSRTNVISAEILASKIQYSAPIIHQEANRYSQEVFLDFAPTVDEELASALSLDMVGTLITPMFSSYYPVEFNFFNESLGDIYLSQQPPKFGNFILKDELVYGILFIFVIFAIVLFLLLHFIQDGIIKDQQKEIDTKKSEIERIERFLALNPEISDKEFDEVTEIINGLSINKSIYSYYTIVGTEIPKKLWLTHLNLSDSITIEGQADNLESVYSFYRNIKDYNPDSTVKLQKLGLAQSKLNMLPNIGEENEDGINAKTFLSTLNADFYEFKISDRPEPRAKKIFGKKQEVVDEINNGNLENIPTEKLK